MLNLKKFSESPVSGDEVRNEQGEYLGKIRQIVRDEHSDKIVHAVIAYRGEFDLIDKLFIVPWKFFTLVPDQEWLQLDARQEEFNGADSYINCAGELKGDYRMTA